MGEIMFGAPNSRGWSYRLCTGGTTIVITAALVGVGSTFPWFRDFIFWDSFSILSVFEDSPLLMVGSDVVHCVWVSFTGTIVVAFWLHESMVGIILYVTLNLYNIVDIGAPL